MPIIEVNHLTKEYQLGHITSLKENVLNTFRRLGGKSVQQRENFKALNDVTFTIEKGEVVGIIGHNGAGKSTLLKHLANISKPTKGKIIVRGSVAPLIEIGAGVNPELTGRENIFLNGAILGIPKKIIQQKLDEIIDFSELEQFIDTPVKRYSSGMTVKLGFSIATSMDADILIIDEVLAVGDLAFQRKCFDKMEDLIKRRGKTVVIVSHNIRQIERMCQRVLLIDHGQVALDGEAGHVCNAFYAYNDDRIIAQQTKAKYLTTGEAELMSLMLFDSSGQECNVFEYNSDVYFRIKFKFNVPQNKLKIVLGVHTIDFVNITTHVSGDQSLPARLEPGVHEFFGKIGQLPLLPGVYAIRISLDVGETITNIFYADHICNFKIVEEKFQRSFPESEGFFRLNVKWNEIPESFKQPSIIKATL